MSPMVEQEFLHELRLIRDSLESLVYASSNKEYDPDELAAWLATLDIKKILEDLAARTDDVPETPSVVNKHFMEFKGSSEPPFGDKNLLIFICRYCNYRINIGRSTYQCLMLDQMKLHISNDAGKCSRLKVR